MQDQPMSNTQKDFNGVDQIARGLAATSYTTALAGVYTVDSLAELGAAPQTRVPFYDGAAFLWTLGDFSALIDNDFYVAADGVPTTVGAWVRQSTDKVLYLDPGTGAKPHNASMLFEHAAWINALTYLTEAQIAEVTSYADTGDHTIALQAALDDAWTTNRNLFIPAGLWRVSNLAWPGTPAGRNKAFRVHGQGYGEIFARAFTAATILKGIDSGQNVITFLQRDLINFPLAGLGNQEVAYLRIEGDSTVPVVFGPLYSSSGMRHCAIWQAGTGDGIHCNLMATGYLEYMYVVNRDWNTHGIGLARTGVGVKITGKNDGGLASLYKVTSRGWLWGYQFGDTVAPDDKVLYSLKVDACESSVTRGGIWLTSRCAGATISSNYLEGGDGGIGILDEGEANSMRDNLIFAGFGTCIDASLTSNFATVIDSNYCALGSVGTAAPTPIGIAIGSGNTGKVCTGNFIAANLITGAGVPGAIGIKITGSSPRIMLAGNIFNPSGNWEVGSSVGAKAIDDQSTGGVIGFTQKLNLGSGTWMPHLSRGSISLNNTTLANSSVSGNTFTPGEGTYFELTHTTGGTSINTIASGTEDGRVLHIYITNGNVTIVNSGFISLAGGTSFVGPGTISFVMRRIGANTFAREISRAKY